MLEQYSKNIPEASRLLLIRRVGYVSHYKLLYLVGKKTMGTSCWQRDIDVTGYKHWILFKSS